MPLANFKVLVRPNPGGLEDHQKYVTKQADDLLKKQRFADLIITSEDGTSIQCHQALVVLRSTFLRGLCSEAPRYPGASDVIHLMVPIPGHTLITIHELLYTGQVNKTRREIEEVSAGLALLGINDFSGMPVKPRAFLHAGITAIPVSRKQNNNNNAAVEVVEMQQFLKDGPPGPKTIVNNPITPLSSQAAGLLVQKLDPTQISVTIKREANNNAETKAPDQEQERTRRKRIQTNPGLDFTDNDEIELEGSPVTGNMEETEDKTPIECEDCGSVLRSEWHRHPSRHDCRADSGVKCPDCGSLLRSSWYLPTSRHSCLSPAAAVTASSHNPSLDMSQESGQQLRPRKKRSLSLGYEDNNSNAKTPKVDADLVAPSPKLKVEVGERQAKFFPCPLDGCSRKCETKKLLLLHLAMSHFLVKMEASYISRRDSVTADGKRKCPHCDLVQPSNKLGFIRHVAMEHEDVMENLAKEFVEKVAKEKEEKDTHTEEDANEVLTDDRTEEETLSEASKTQTDGVKAGQSSDPDSEKEKAVMECDPMMED